MSRANNGSDLALGAGDWDVKCRCHRLCMGFIIKPLFAHLEVHVEYFFLAFVSGRFEK